MKKKPLKLKMEACTSFRLTTGTPIDQSLQVRMKSYGRHAASQGHEVPEFRQDCQISSMLSFHLVLQNPSQP